jgi:hypothetical protein
MSMQGLGIANLVWNAFSQLQAPWGGAAVMCDV